MVLAAFGRNNDEENHGNNADRYQKMEHGKNGLKEIAAFPFVTSKIQRKRENRDSCLYYGSNDGKV